MKKILVVDDEPDVIEAIRTILEVKGYKVISSDNKQEALKLAKSSKPDLAILDVIMSTQYEGFELAKDMVNDQDCNKIPILLYTSIDVITTSDESVREMVTQFRQKPNFKDLQVILVKDIVSGKAGIDYRTEDGKAVWIPVNGFLKKPVDPEKLLQEVKSLIGN